MGAVLARSIVKFALLVAVAAPLGAQGSKSFKDEFDTIVADFHREASAAKGNRRGLMDAKRRFEDRLEKCLRQIQASGSGSPPEKDLIVAVAIAEQLSRNDEVVAMSDQILRRNPNCDAAVYAKFRGLIGLSKLEDAEQHVRQALEGADELSGRYSMCGLLMAAFEERKQWQKGVEYGTLFLTWCSRTIRAHGTVDVSVSSFLDLFAQCADEAGDSHRLQQIIDLMNGDVTAAIGDAKDSDGGQGPDFKKLRFLFQLKHHLCCLSQNNDPGACVAAWLRLFTASADAAQPPPPPAIAEAANAGVSSLCLARDLDALQTAARDCRTAFENLPVASKAGEPAHSGVAALKRLESMTEIERAVRGMRGKSMDVLEKADWQHRPQKAGPGPTIVYIWSPSGSNPGLTLRQNLSKIRDTTTLPLTIVSPNTEGPPALVEDAAAERRQNEGAAIRQLAGGVSDEIAVACIDGKLLSEKLPIAALPQVYLLDATGRVELAVVGIDKWRLKSLQATAQKLSLSKR